MLSPCWIHFGNFISFIKFTLLCISNVRMLYGTIIIMIKTFLLSKNRKKKKYHHTVIIMSGIPKTRINEDSSPQEPWSPGCPKWQTSAESVPQVKIRKQMNSKQSLILACSSTRVDLMTLSTTQSSIVFTIISLVKIKNWSSKPTWDTHRWVMVFSKMKQLKMLMNGLNNICDY